ncbi:citryl-CoA lyase [Thalassobaculum fulvum]|jgi:citrate synthase|uniref:Citryl-CoA lyase n=1 Tax=Thalassobaculum fulvum TaxID=1633335 RepID=A0A918XPT9_9PROT|nr:citryl-CoA lyase [Thalassobaculum fulvum]GHD45653.1 citryl-CoA lyase [Thalassobaculum fulvum]
MSFMPDKQTTSIATHTNEDIYIRDRSLCRELIGKLSFTEMIYFQILGRMPTPAQTAVVDACLVTLMEHGLTPSALATRLIYSSAPEAMQAGVAAGLMGVGSVFVGTMEGCATLLAEILAAPEGVPAAARRVAEEHRAARRPLPGFGHHLHRPDDPRSIRLFQVARDQGVADRHVEAVLALSAAVDEVYGKHITINATGAIAACLGDCGVPAEILRGFALITRCAGLVGHVHEEQHKPAMRAIWEAADEAVAYDGTIPTGEG